MPVAVKFKLEGVKKTFGIMGRISKEVKQAIDEGVYEAALHLKRESNKVAPIEDGHLIEESFVHVEYKKGAQTTAIVGYGPPGSVSEAYALRQHEDPTLKHKKVVGRKWKYLESPFRKNKRKMISIVRQRIKKAIKARKGRSR